MVLFLCEHRALPKAFARLTSAQIRSCSVISLRLRPPVRVCLFVKNDGVTLKTIVYVYHSLSRIL